jgi:hypothetical protein
MNESSSEVKSFAHRRHSPIRQRCIEFLLILKKYGYANEIPLESAKVIFSKELGLCDRGTVGAYFGSQAGRSIRKINRMSRYSSGTLSFKTIELSQNIQAKKGYLELLGLASIEKRGSVWFLVVKDSSVVPELGFSGVHTCESVCLSSAEFNANFSLSTYSPIGAVEGWEGNPSKHKGQGHSEGVPEESNGDTERDRSYTHTLQVEREKSLLRHISLSAVHEVESGLAPELLAILSAKPQSCEPDKAKTNLRECGQ